MSLIYSCTIGRTFLVREKKKKKIDVFLYLTDALFLYVVFSQCVVKDIFTWKDDT